MNASPPKPDGPPQPETLTLDTLGMQERSQAVSTGLAGSCVRENHQNREISEISDQAVGRAVERPEL
jgi:hypothetical protein